MTRLLFAAARGARIEAQDKNLGWILSSHAPLELSNDKRPCRIHPDDEHLQYGPISTALRDWALAQEYIEIEDEFIHAAAYNLQRNYRGVEGASATKESHGIFLLILAEALADEGM